MSDDDEPTPLPALPRDTRGRRMYSDHEIAQALALLEVNGGNVNQTSEALGIPEPTLRGWANGNRREVAGALAAQLHEATKRAMAQRFEGLAFKLLDVVDANMDDLDAKSAMIAAAVATDKMLLLRGEATTITEHRSEGEEQKREAIRQRYTRARVIKSEPLPAPEQPQSGEGPAPPSEAPDPV